MSTGPLSHKIYFWFNEPTNYFTDITYPNGPPPPSISFRPANTHVIGKDILGFRAINSPAFLLPLNLPLPCRVPNSPTGQVLEAGPGWPVLVMAMTGPD